MSDAPATLPDVARSGFSCDDDPPRGAATGSASSGLTRGTPAAGQEAGQGPDPYTPGDLRWLGEELLGTLTLAVRRHVAMTPKRARRAIAERVTRITTREQALTYIVQVERRAAAQDASLRRARRQRRDDVDDGDRPRRPRR